MSRIKILRISRWLFCFLSSISSTRQLSVQVVSYVYVLLSFITAPLGGFLVGYLAGLMAALVLKYTSERDEYLKPILNLLFAALAYMITLLCGFSNILGLIAYGIAQTRYGVGNMR